jgi:predicted GNAT family acetyltransferase
MSLAPLMSSLDARADTGSDAGQFMSARIVGDSSASAADRIDDPAVRRSLKVVAPVALVGLPSDGSERAAHTESFAVDPMEVPFDLTEETNRDLRRWSNALYRVLDQDFPPFGAIEDYERVVAEIEGRKARAGEASPSVMREKFRDNALSRRFELFRNGQLAGYVNYTMRAGSMRLLRTVVAEDFDGMGLEGVLMHRVILMAHKRRLAAIPCCPVARSFLLENPQYRQLMHA